MWTEVRRKARRGLLRVPRLQGAKVTMELTIRSGFEPMLRRREQMTMMARVLKRTAFPVELTRLLKLTALHNDDRSSRRKIAVSARTGTLE